MTAASHLLQADSSAVSGQSFRTPLQLLTGFFFAFRFSITYLGFQSDPRTGSIIVLACSALLLAAALTYTLGDDQFSLRCLLASRTMRWLLLYLAMSGLSLFWTGAESIVDAGALWTGMVMEVAIVLLLVKKPNVDDQVDALLKGFVV